MIIEIFSNASLETGIFLCLALEIFQIYVNFCIQNLTMQKKNLKYGIFFNQNKHSRSHQRTLRYQYTEYLVYFLVFPTYRLIRYGGSKVEVGNYGRVNMMYACITVLRALSLMDGPSSVWRDYTAFCSHLEERMKTEVYTKVRKGSSRSCCRGLFRRKEILFLSLDIFREKVYTLQYVSRVPDITIFVFSIGQQGEGCPLHPPLPQAHHQVQRLGDTGNVWTTG